MKDDPVMYQIARVGLSLPCELPVWPDSDGDAALRDLQRTLEARRLLEPAAS